MPVIFPTSTKAGRERTSFPEICITSPLSVGTIPNYPNKYFNTYNQFDATTSCYLCSKANPKHSLGSISEGDNEGLYVAYLGKQL